MRRRDFITLLGGTAAARPLATHAQQRAKLPTIGILASGTPEAQGRWWAAFVEQLRVLGWIEGRNVAIEHRWAEGRSERFTEIAAEFVRLNVEIIITDGTPAIAAAKRATPVIPIVFAAAGDPVVTGLVASLARPGNNVTGMSLMSSELGAKRLELLRALPKITESILPQIEKLCWVGFTRMRHALALRDDSNSPSARCTQAFSGDGACSERTEPPALCRDGSARAGTWRGEPDVADQRAGTLDDLSWTYRHSRPCFCSDGANP